MKGLRAIAVVLLVLGTLIGAFAEIGGKKTLVLLESDEVKKTHSIFLKSLEERGYVLSYSTVDEDSVAFKSFGEWNYDHLILFAPSTPELPTGLSAKTILDFIDDGRNVLVVGGTEIGKPLRDIASDCNVEFDEEGTFVIDHFNFERQDDGQHTLLAVDPANVVASSIIFEQPIDAPILFKGIGQDIEEDSALLFSVLHGSSSSYSHNPEEPVEDLHVAGKRTSLVSALQARNNARVVFAGSLELFSDQYFKASVEKQTADGKTKTFEKSGNEQFAKQLVQWLFQERGILRAVNVQHHRAGETVAPATYTIKDDIEYSVEIQEWNGKKWVPFLANDVQLEFRMLDPYVRTTLQHDSKGKYTASFKLPDVYGVFTFKIEYTRRGYGFLTSITRTPVRPFRHNEYERFIESAYPYYASAFSMMAGLFLFSWFFLYHRETKL
jgi:oligosaccharyltransferase complex subunit beta